ncbi:MAG: GAF domain-containing sensor histidine kinase [Anaerolineales bacterium]|nr:GAF domain-containing sensor histidine kinase [Anaerolineales bacterium]
MSPQLFGLIAMMVLAALHVPALIRLLSRRIGQETTALLFANYLLANMLLTAAEGLWRGGQLQFDPQTARAAQIYVASALSFILLFAIRYFVRRDVRAWLIVGAIWLGGFFIIAPNLLGFGDTIWTNGSIAFTRDQLAPAWAIVGWIVFTLGAFISVRSSHNRSRQPLLRNRLNYWTPAFFLILINDILLFSGFALPGNPLRLIAAVIGALIIVTHDPPDLREVARRVLTYVITTLVILIFYVAGITVSQTVFNALPLYNPLLVGAGIALLLSLIFTPLLSVVRRVVNGWFNLQEYNPSRTLHAYSEQISNILDMQRLANVAVGLIIEAMDITRGFLFLVDPDIVSGEKNYRLRAVRNQGERQIRIVTLKSDHPVAKYFTTEQRPLLQYDLDLLPAFRAVSPPEREWFNHLEAEVYLPIFSKREWIGLLALGAKIAGTRYTEADLVTLSALANQTAVALENARLVDNLMQLNTELRQAYRNLDKANRDLERLDQTKSDFISIASHELRTPLTTIIGYTEMLIEDTTLPSGIHSMLKNISKGTKRLHEIMDSMFDIAQIDSRTMQPHLAPVDTAALIREVSAGIEKAVKEREQILTLDIPALPMVKADPNLLEKLFQHLLNNAVKFTPDQGKLKVEARQVTASNSDFPHGGLEFIVSDTGVGVDPDSREIIFSKFYQPGEVNKHSTSKTRFKGSGAGLGLALSKGIVEAHGGRIWVESAGYDEEKFPGSQFHVMLPLGVFDKGEKTVMMGNEAKLEIA